MRTGALAKLSLTGTLLLVTVGGFTRGSGSGYGCSDRWPLCEDGLLGGLLPRWEYHMIVEWTHRWLAALVGVLAVATALSAWRHFRSRAVVLVPAIAAVVTIGVQAWVGRLVVEGQLAADLVTLHLVISMTVVALLTIVVVATIPDTEGGRARNRGWTIRVGIAASASFLLLLLGSFVHNRYFPGWPLMDNMLLPDLSNLATLAHFMHRLLAGVLLAYLIYLIAAANRIGRSMRERQVILTTTVLYTINIGLGAAHVFTMVSSALLVAAHLGLAGVVWALLVAAAAMSTVVRRVPVLQ